MDDHDSVGKLRHLREHVTGDEHGSPPLGEPTQKAAQPADALGVEAIGRLVEDQNVRVTEQRAGDSQTLAHAE